MPYDLIVIAHHGGAVLLFLFVVGGALAGRIVATEEARRNALTVEGMGGMAAVLFQVVSGANLTGRADIAWSTPWVTVAVVLLGVAVVLWLASIARRMKGLRDGPALLLVVLATVCLLGAYGAMTVKPSLG
jgi:hypothetical protein